MAIDRVCILGHSGIGKSPLSALFAGDRFEPRRKRKPRNSGDYVISDGDFEEERRSHPLASAIYSDTDPGGDWEAEVYPDVSFLKVRQKDQLLEHRDPAPSIPLRIEIYAPILDALLKNQSKLPPNLANRLDPRRTVAIVLNPTDTSFAAMSGPTSELSISVFAATTERARAQGRAIDLSDTLGRIRSLDTELPAWRNILANPSVTSVECCCWPHFEYQYYIPDGTLGDAISELRRARETVMAGIKAVASSAVLSDIESMMLGDDHLARLEKII